MVLAFSLALAAGCGKAAKHAPSPVIERRVLMGTEVTITAWDPKIPEAGVIAAVGAAFARMERLEAMLSRHKDDSGLSRLNAAAGSGPAAVSPELLKAVTLARRAFDASGGAFDPSVGPLVRLWVAAAKADRIPSDADIDAARASVGFGRVTVDEKAGTVNLPAGMSMDLGGIAKGMIVDEAAAAIRAAGISNAIVEAGGDLFAFGSRPDGSAWRIGIQDPSAGIEVTEGKIACVLKVSGKGVTTSGHYRRSSTIQGKKYSHILDPRTGRPVDQAVLSVTVIAPDAATADGLSTAVAVLGPVKGLELLESINGAEGLLMTAGADADGPVKILETSGLAAFRY